MTNLTTILTFIKKTIIKKQNVKNLNDINPHVINDNFYDISDHKPQSFYDISDHEAQDEKIANYFEETPVSDLIVTVHIPLLVTITITVIAGSPEKAKQLAQANLENILQKNASLQHFSVSHLAPFDKPIKNGIIYNYDVCVRKIESNKIKGFEKPDAIDMAIQNFLDSQLYFDLSSSFKVTMPSYLRVYHESHYNYSL